MSMWMILSIWVYKFKEELMRKEKFQSSLTGIKTADKEMAQNKNRLEFN